jgi:TPR repeat protein
VTKQSSAPEKASGARSGTLNQNSSANNKPVLPGAAGAGNEVGTRTNPEKLATAEPRAPTPIETGSRVRTAAANGSEELSIAEGYLKGTEGKARDSGEAVKWLWKAVAKQNEEATELLADLYLKGEEVPRNCEQARLLLDAAARRGVKEAAERLRHLQDSACE